MKHLILKHLMEASDMLHKLMSDDEQLENIAQAANIIISTYKSAGKVIVAGNGGSMSDAMHFAAELMGKYRGSRNPLAAIAICDPGYLSCVANDFNFDAVFSRAATALCKPEDTLFLISTSGQSENIELAAIASDYRSLCPTILLTSEKVSPTIESMVKVCIKVPASAHADRIQELHIKILHIIVDFVEKELGLQ